MTARSSKAMPPRAEPQRRGPGSRADENHPTRLELLDAAVQLAEREGLQALSVARITDAAGHAKGTFYVHFPDRAAFLVAMHRWFHDTVFSQVIADTAGDPPGTERARQRLVAFLDACRSLPGVRALLVEARTDPAVAEEVQRRNRQAANMLASDLAGTCTHPRETARLLVIAAADIAGRESAERRQLATAREALLTLVSDAPRERLVDLKPRDTE